MVMSEGIVVAGIEQSRAVVAEVVEARLEMLE